MASLKSRLEHCVTPNALRAYLAEFISTFIFVFAAVGASISTRKMMPDAPLEPASLTAIAIASAFGMVVAVYIASNVSGGHVNPAVTFGMVVGGHINITMSIFYWISQILGSVMACFLLKITTVSQHIPTSAIPNDMTGVGAAIIEGVMTFALVYTVYAASAESKRGGFLGGGVGFLAIGLIVGANVLASGPFTGGSMNPAYSFGSALVGGSFKNHAAYWVGPFIGAGAAATLYDNVVCPNQEPEAVLEDIVSI
ncbi:hypothetical protein Leryth_003775 [Lithospermum erythrorhizon]|nr:hypothetical protein Leryth_003775 [Lithospermum erythrorhizon]